VRSHCPRVEGALARPCARNADRRRGQTSAQKEPGAEKKSEGLWGKCTRGRGTMQKHQEATRAPQNKTNTYTRACRVTLARARGNGKSTPLPSVATCRHAKQAAAAGGRSGCGAYLAPCRASAPAGSNCTAERHESSQNGWTKEVPTADHSRGPRPVIVQRRLARAKPKRNTQGEDDRSTSGTIRGKQHWSGHSLTTATNKGTRVTATVRERSPATAHPVRRPVHRRTAHAHMSRPRTISGRPTMHGLFVTSPPHGQDAPSPTPPTRAPQAHASTVGNQSPPPRAARRQTHLGKRACQPPTWTLSC